MSKKKNSSPPPAISEEEVPSLESAPEEEVPDMDGSIDADLSDRPLLDSEIDHSKPPLPEVLPSPEEEPEVPSWRCLQNTIVPMPNGFVVELKAGSVITSLTHDVLAIVQAGGKLEKL